MILTENRPIRLGRESKNKIYGGMTAVLATKHGKEHALEDALGNELGLQLCVREGIDTDVLGTYSGEVPRRHRIRETVRRKALMGMEITGCFIGIATEGSFGPDPVVPFLPVHSETMIFIDNRLELEVTETISSNKTNFGHVICEPGENIDSFLEKMLFPRQGMIVRPESPYRLSRFWNSYHAEKGIVDGDQLQKAIQRCSRNSRTGKAVVETDMRAHLSPLRMSVIKDLGSRMAKRLNRHCPSCSKPGWGITFRKQGLPCDLCGLPTAMILHEIWGCAICKHTGEHPRSDGLKRADPTYCNFCNP
jgi:hypothetical protein